jgi:hypothetical protein
MAGVPFVLLAEHRGETISGPRFVLDGGSFENCRFVDAVLIYGGGPCILRNCSYERCRLFLHGPGRWTHDIYDELVKIAAVGGSFPPAGRPGA